MDGLNWETLIDLHNEGINHSITKDEDSGGAYDKQAKLTNFGSLLAEMMLVFGIN